ncbi:MAG: maltose alpha-D-glucosyltransferase [Pseudomonadota bacterium]
MNLLSSIEMESGVTNDDLWYKDAIIYQLHVKTFADSNNDGIGDFTGLTEKLGYLQELGVTALWLMPFYPSPGRDDGYDIADYGSISPDLGTMKDFKRFIGEAKRRGMRVITELVINHTSDQHAWFKRARRSPAGSSARDWYVWSDTDQKYANTRIIFSDTEKSNWTWDPEAHAYYWHRFFSHQPDLNFANPRVVRSVVQVMKRWVDAGVDGFRLDAIPYLCEEEGSSNENLPGTHEVIRLLRRELDAYGRDKIFLAEANQWPEDVQHYFGKGDECHMAFHFPLMPRIYMAIAQEDRFPITDILRQTPDIPENCQWAMFLRNHDELTLEMVSDIERDYLWSTYAADPRARINGGIRRRLAPLMDNDRRKIELMNSLLLSFPGTPIIYYGDEIGMGDNIYLGDRNGVRTPMQWSPDRNGGFSRADPARLFAPTIMDPVYGYESVNVEAQSRSLSSLLNWTKRLIAVRKSTLAFGRGSIRFIRPENRCVLAYVREYRGDAILCVANLSRSAQATELDLSPWKDRVPVEMLGQTGFPAIGDRPYMITLAPYGFYWFKLTEKELSPHVTTDIVPELETLVVPLGATWVSLERTRNVFERDVLPPYLARSRWFHERNAPMISAKVTSAVPFCNEGDWRPWIVMFMATRGSKTTRHALPIRIKWEQFDEERRNPAALATVRQGSRQGTLFDVAGDQAFLTMLIGNIRSSAIIEEREQQLEFRPADAFLNEEIRPIENIRSIESDSTDTAAFIGENYVVKFYRQIEAGPHPDIEIGHFLTDVVGFAHAPRLLGSVELVEGDRRSAIASVHGFVGNQGDLWNVTAGFLDRLVEQQRFVGDAPTEKADWQASYHHLLSQAGRRVADLHVALTSRDDIAAFRPEAASEAEAQDWIDSLSARARTVHEQLRRYESTNPNEQRLIGIIAGRLASVDGWLANVRPSLTLMQRIRHHGTLQLGRMLIVKDDIAITSFGGDLRLPLEARRRKLPAARDVATVIRSIDAAAIAALARAEKIAPDEGGKLAAALDTWRERSAATFTVSYRDAMTADNLWPADAEAAERVLTFFVIEKLLDDLSEALAGDAALLPAHLADAARILPER